MRQFYMRKFALIFGVFLLLSGCKTGLNFAALSLGPEDIKDYGAMAKENSVAPGTATYGVLPSGIESSSAVKLTRDTDLIRFMRLLSTNKTVVLTEDEASEEFIKALSVAIINNRAEPYGLKAHYVYGFNAENFSKSKKLFGMQDSEYQSYVESMAKKAHAQKSEDDKLAIIFVVFIDDFGANLDLSEFIKNLSLGQSRVVLVTKNLSAFKDTSTFISQGIDLMSSYYVAKATIKAINPQIDTNLAIEPLIKMYYGLKSRPEQMNLVSLQRAVKEMLLRLSKKSAAAALPDYEIAAKETLAALEEKIPVEIAEDSTVLVTTLVDVEKHVLANPFYFLDKCKSKNDEFQDEMRKTRLQNEKLTETGAESNERKAKKHYLESIYIGYRGKLENAPPEPEFSKLVNNYTNSITKAELKTISILYSMTNLLENELCVFKIQDEIPTAPKKGFDGGQVSFVESVGKQKFNENLVKNPMQLFDIKANGQVLAPAAPSPEERAAIGLNCFLTGRRKANNKDGQHVLNGKVQTIATEITRVCEEARDFASAMDKNNLARFSAAHLELRERLKEDTRGAPWRVLPVAANANYWKRILSLTRNPKPGTMAMAVLGLQYGVNFNLQGHLLPYPTDFTDADLLPAVYGAVGRGGTEDLPEHFIATREPFPTVGVTVARTGGGQTSFHGRAAAMLGTDYSVINAYGLSLQTAQPGLRLALAGTGGFNPIPLGVPAWLADFQHADFVQLNRRVWSWFLSRIVGKIPTGTIAALDNDLYDQQNVNLVPTDLFSRNEVFIDVLFDKTNKFIQDSNRSLIALFGLKVLENYKQMAESLYSLRPVDYKAFLQQAPATPLSAFFIEVERILAAQTNIADINAGNRAQVDNWRASFISPAIEAGLLALAGAAPIAGSIDAKLDMPGNSRWGALQAKALEIDDLRLKIRNQITVIK